jgi:hypothetical protein
MQFKNIILAAALTLTTSVFAATSPSDLAIGLQNNIVGLDIGQKQTTLLLNHLSHHTGDVTPDVSDGPARSFDTFQISITSS